MNEKIAAIHTRLSGMKSLIPAGAVSDEQIAKYFAEQDAVIEDIVKTLDDMDSASTSEKAGVENAIKALRDSLKAADTGMKQLTEHDVCYQMGKALVSAWNNDVRSLGELKCCPNLRAEKWNNPKDFTWTHEKGFTVKEALGEPIGNMATNDQYLINPVYEDYIMTDALKKSVMMNLVSTRPMTGPSMFIPEHDRGGIQLKWLTATGQKIEATKPNGATRRELKAYTLAGYIPWYDEFEEDVYVDLGKMFIDEFSEAYAVEFDRQCLTASKDPFTGAIAAQGAASYEIAGGVITKLDYTDFRDAELKVSPEERKDCKWFFHESVLNKVANIKDANGDPIWRKPGDGKPGNVDGYDYYESSLLPQYTDIAAATPFAVFMNPKRIIHGNRKGIEIKRFEGTSESLEYGELFMRFRKRDGFLVSRPKDNIVVMKTAAA